MRLQFSLQFDKDLERLFEFLTQASHSVKTADKAIQAIKDGAESLLLNPELGTEMQDGTGRRELYIPFGKNNYALRYMLDFETKIIRILRIWHGREGRDEAS